MSAAPDASASLAAQVEAVLDRRARSHDKPSDADLRPVFDFLRPSFPASLNTPSSSTSPARPPNTHWFCSKTPKTRIREAATFLIFLFAFQQTGTSKEWVDALEGVLDGCERCARAFSATRGQATAPAWPLLDAPEIGVGVGIGSRPRPQRARSLLQPFPPSRTEIGARSLSFSGLDDPFAFPSQVDSVNKGTLEKVTEGHAADSTDKDISDSRTERTTTSSPIVEPQGQIRKPLIGLKSNLDFAVTPFRLGAFAMPSSVSQPTPFHSTITPAFGAGQFNSTPLHHDLPSSGILATPLTRRPINHSNGTGPGTGAGTGTAGRGWLLSSPANAEAAAALGLQAHAWYPETPGFVGVVIAETPVRSLRAKGKAVALVREDGDD